MNFKKFGNVILVLGGLIFLFGGFQWISNQPKKFNQAESRTSPFGGRDDFGNALSVMGSNIDRTENRENAIKILIAGGIIAFVGLGISYSAKEGN
jgi:hypothetical protein